MADADLGIEGITGSVVVGQGGFGTVYRAEQPAFRRTVAVKILHVPDRDEAAQHRFRRECQAMGSLADHPNIATLYDAGFLADGRAYIVMAFMGGGSLHERAAATGSMAWEDITGTGVKLAGALETAHRAGILHRDLKPANVLVSSFGEPQLTDFGIARIAGGHETRSGLITASIPYAPPEILDGRPPSVASDVYGLAATLVHLATGQPPFTERTDESNAPILRRVYIDEVPDLAPFGIPAPVSSVLGAAMTKEPTGRIPSAEAFGQALRAAEQHLGRAPTPMQIEGVAPSPATRVVGSAAATPLPPMPPPPPPPRSTPTPAGPPPAQVKPSRPHWWWIGAGLAVLVALIVGGIVAATRGNDGDTATDDGSASTFGATSEAAVTVTAAPPTTADDTGSDGTASGADTDDGSEDDGSDDDDAATDGSSTDSFALGEVVEGQLRSGEPVVRTFEAEAGETLRATLTTSTPFRQVELIDPDGQTRVVADEVCLAATTDQTVLTAGLPTPGTYTLVIDGGGADGDFTLTTEANPDLFDQSQFVTVAVDPRQPDATSRYYGFSADGDLLLRVTDIAGDLVAYSDDCGEALDPWIAGASSGGPVDVRVEAFDQLPAGTTLGLLDAAGFTASGTLVDGAVIGLASDLQPGEVWQLTARSGDNDAFLTVIDPTGSEVATDDDSAGGFDATVTVQAATAGVHEVVLTFLGAGGGTFTVEAFVQ